MPKQPHEAEKGLTPEQQARRRLLKLGAYVPPMILGMAIMTQTGVVFASGSGNHDGGGSSGSGGDNNGNDDRPSCSPNCCAPAGSNANRKGCDSGGKGGNTN